MTASNLEYQGVQNISKGAIDCANIAEIGIDVSLASLAATSIARFSAPVMAT